MDKLVKELLVMSTHLNTLKNKFLVGVMTSILQQKPKEVIQMVQLRPIAEVKQTDKKVKLGKEVKQKAKEIKMTQEKPMEKIKQRVKRTTVYQIFIDTTMVRTQITSIHKTSQNQETELADGDMKELDLSYKKLKFKKQFHFTDIGMLRMVIISTLQTKTKQEQLLQDKLEIMDT